jgi:Xaa-Pro dipeptidase
MRRTDRAGRVCHWILEVHLVDRRRGFGGIFEQLLTLRTSADLRRRTMATRRLSP